ncbi:MAG: serine/threonine protein kinase, partial [Planctomycetaceae bacterium]|nr:serine/threonine protein kinase [Planctomycetaceae bacterium]
TLENRHPDSNGPGVHRPQDSDATVLSGEDAAAHVPKSVNELGKLLEGRQLGDYHLNKFVGGGGMGAVFKALDTTLDRTVAVKVLAGHRSTDEEMLRRFRNEAQSAARLNHENIGLVHAVGSSDGWHFIVFEYIEGTNLRDLVRQRGPLAVATVVDISMQIAAALDHACHRDVTHRDIKPSNILLTPEGRAKLVDMGLARLQHIAGEQDLTVSGITLGTFDYISPEQARDARSADIRSDLYSLGCTMFFMLVGRAPFAEGTMVQKLLQHQQEVPPEILNMRAETPHRLASVVHKLMAKRPEERFQHPAALEFELLSIAEEEGFDVTVSRAAIEPNVSVSNAADVSYWPWVLAVVGLISLVWWTAIAFPVSVSTEKQAAGINYQIQDFGDTSVVRVVPQPTQDNEFDTVAAAVAYLTAGGVIELSGDSEYEIGPTYLGTDMHVTIRGESEKRPVLRITPSLKSSFGSEDPVFLIEGGHLTLKNLDIRLGDENVDKIAGYTSIFELSNGGHLTCTNTEVSSVPIAIQESSGVGDTLVLARIRASRRSQQEDTTYSLKAIELFADVSDEVRVSAEENSIKIENSLVKGNLTCFVCESSTATSLSWSGGGVTVDRRFLTVRGSSARPFEPAKVQLRLRDATFACQDGFARLEDAPGQDDVPQLRVVVDRCRFIIPESVVLLEQIGVAEPEVYQRAINWTDNRGRYEGGSIFRKIDGAGNAIEIDYSSAGQPMDYQDFVGGQRPLFTD